MIIGKKCIFAENRSPMKKFPDTDGATPRLTLVNDLRQVSLLTGFVDRVREEYDLAPALAARINLALEEAVCNVIMYAYPEGTAGTMDLEAVREGNQLRFTLVDRGRPSIPPPSPRRTFRRPWKTAPSGVSASTWSVPSWTASAMNAGTERMF